MFFFSRGPRLYLLLGCWHQNLHETLLKKASERFPGEAAVYQASVSGRTNIGEGIGVSVIPSNSIFIFVETFQCNAENGRDSGKGSGDEAMPHLSSQSEMRVAGDGLDQSQTANEPGTKADVKPPGLDKT